MPSASHVRAPARPGLQRDVVPARGERPPEGDHREGVAGVAEGAQQDAQGGWARGSQRVSLTPIGCSSPAG